MNILSHIIYCLVIGVLRITHLLVQLADRMISCVSLLIFVRGSCVDTGWLPPASTVVDSYGLVLTGLHSPMLPNSLCFLSRAAMFELRLPCAPRGHPFPVGQLERERLGVCGEGKRNGEITNICAATEKRQWRGSVGSFAKSSLN